MELALQTWASQHFLTRLEKQWKKQKDKPDVYGVGIHFDKFDLL